MGDLDDQLQRLAQQRADRVPATSAATAMASPPSHSGRGGWMAAAAAVLVVVGLGVWMLAGDTEPGTDVAGTTTTVPTTAPASPTSDPPTSTTQPEPATTLQTVITDFGLSFDAPAAWIEVEDRRTLSGDSGWVAIEPAPAGSLDDSATEVEAEAGPSLGTSPTRSTTTVAGRPAVLVTGSEPVQNDDFGFHQTAVAIIAVPAPFIVDGETVTNILIGGSAATLDEILASVRWTQPLPTFPSGIASTAAVTTPDGIFLRDGAGTTLGRFPVDAESDLRIAFWLPPSVVLYESTSEDQATNVISLATAGEELAIAEGRVTLFDAATVDGVPTALLTRRTGDTPETAEERLLVVNLLTLNETDLGVFGGWESGSVEARFGDGAIVLARAAEGFEWTQAIDYAGVELWSTEESDIEPQGTLAVDGETVIRIRALQPGGRLPYVRWQTFDLPTGDFVGSFARPFTDDDDIEVWGQALGDVQCERPDWGVVLWCNGATVGDVPVMVDLDIGLVQRTPGVDVGLVTRTRSVSSVAPERHPCGRSNGSSPHDSLSITPIEVDDGRTMDVLLWNDADNRLLVQGFLPGWSTNRVELLGDYIHDLPTPTVSAAEEGEPSADHAFVVFTPDAFHTESFASGYTTSLSFDGCELAVASSGIVN